MYIIKLNIGGIDKEFKKDYINIEDNLLAVEHQVRQSAVYSDEKAMYDPKKHRSLNESYLKMFVEMFGRQFNVEDLKKADMSLLETLNKLYLAALGGTENTSEEDEKKKE